MQTDLTRFDALKGSISTFLAPLSAITVRDKIENMAAKGHLTSVKAFAREIEDQRTAAVAPFNDAVKRINAYAKELAAPLEDAEGDIKKKMKEFAEAEQHRLEIERNRAQEAAAAERRRLYQEQEAREHAQRERERSERMRLAEEERQRVAASEEARLARQAFGVKTDAEVLAKVEEAERLAAKIKADVINRRLDQERQETLERVKREIGDAEAAAQARMKALEKERPKNMTTLWKYEIVERLEVPMEFWNLDESKIGQAVRGGAREIPGLRIYSEQVVVAGR